MMEMEVQHTISRRPARWIMVEGRAWWLGIEELGLK